MRPIWESRYVDLSDYLSEGKAPFTIKDSSGTVIYTGTAYADADNNCSIKINDICAQHFSPASLTGLNAGTANDHLLESFTVYSGSDLVDSEDFSFDWSYEEDFDPAEVDCLSRSINPVFCTGMPIKYSYYNENSESFFLRTLINRRSDLDSPFYCKHVDCGDSALYYRNSVGGADFLLLAGLKPKQTYNRNVMYTADGKDEYLNEVTQQWTCYTGRVKYPERIGELLGSTRVWLWTLADGFRPVIIKATSAAALTYKTNGRKPVEFSFDIESVDDMQRR